MRGELDKYLEYDYIIRRKKVRSMARNQEGIRKGCVQTIERCVQHHLRTNQGVMLGH